MTGSWEAKDELRGIRGWLLLPLAHLILNVGLVFLTTISIVEATTMSRGPAIALLAAAAYLALIAVCLFLFLQESRSAKAAMFAFYGVTLLLSIVWLFQAFSVFVLLEALLSVGSAVYFQRSVRVQNTFFR